MSRVSPQGMGEVKTKAKETHLGRRKHGHHLLCGRGCRGLLALDHDGPPRRHDSLHRRHLPLERRGGLGALRLAGKEHLLVCALGPELQDAALGGDELGGGLRHLRGRELERRDLVLRAGARKGPQALDLCGCDDAVDGSGGYSGWTRWSSSRRACVSRRRQTRAPAVAGRGGVGGKGEVGGHAGARAFGECALWPPAFPGRGLEASRTFLPSLVTLNTSQTRPSSLVMLAETTSRPAAPNAPVSVTRRLLWSGPSTVTMV